MGKKAQGKIERKTKVTQSITIPAEHYDRVRRFVATLERAPKRPKVGGIQRYLPTQLFFSLRDQLVEVVRQHADDAGYVAVVFLPLDVADALAAGLDRALGVRAPGHVEHRFRGKPNTHSDGSRTPIPGRSNSLRAGR